MSSASLGYEHVINKTRVPERGKWIMVPALHTGERKAVNGLHLEQKSYLLLRELESRFSQPKDLVMAFLHALLSGSGVLHISLPPSAREG